jgi:flavin-dependent dehydrogenase
MSQKRFRLGIIGGGITGCYAAYLASKKGIKVEIFERTNQKIWLNEPLPTRKCGEGVWKKKLEDAGIKFSLKSSPSYLEKYTKKILLGYFQQEKLKILEGEIEPYLFLNRQVMEKFFYEKAREKGAVWHFGENINNLKDWQKRNNFDLIIGSWGTEPNLTAQVFKGNYRQRHILACQYTLWGVDSARIKDAKTLIFADDPSIRYFYVFSKRRGQISEANVGVVFNSLMVKKPFSRLKKFIELDPLGIFLKARLYLERSFAKTLPSGPPIKKKDLSNPRVLLVGDAGFTTDAVSGGGIGFGLLTAKAAVDSCFSPVPQKEFYERLGPLLKNLERAYLVSEKLYPSEVRKKIKVNRELFACAKRVVQTGGVLSLGKIAEAALEI